MTAAGPPLSILGIVVETWAALPDEVVIGVVPTPGWSGHVRGEGTRAQPSSAARLG
jgi:hypothetical protein